MMSSATVRVHDRTQARVALDWASVQGLTIRLASASTAACYTGPLYWRSLELELDERVTVDCGELPGIVMGGLRVGLKSLLFGGEPAVARKLAQLAEQHRAELLTGLPPPLVELAPPWDAHTICRHLSLATPNPVTRLGQAGRSL
jgi:hypothetical protein